MAEKAKKNTAKKNVERKGQEVYRKRLEKHMDELRWLYMELYNNGSMFAELCSRMEQFYQERNAGLKRLDESREAHPDWYKQNDMLGMMFYIDNFAGNLKGVKGRIDYLERANVNYIHLMPFLDTVEGRSDGGYAVAERRSWNYGGSGESDRGAAQKGNQCLHGLCDEPYIGGS